ncbi:efflux RND transporter periplasmic adaptor subunit [Sinorhizobium meliloti]|uniref:efflux RND transporter periplasmic adaptor subunit n=1 Tax=Rhizobium meliloti TaxID=382 RepID=UPI0002A56593|nr:efflux RND transporter periplasmic adaptor subunit [Sinorhizobium meliloti]AGA09578.1 RND family efflux transporter, MFP subunit [Sinorhizobium meliloti GR4]MDE3876435.1 efflux RND transporter periplasmic adaptor subunit [Sinorhizobium meliloti]RVL06444.1 efflux RND transporter periplasmic adaptor subunit [Sinorhizobium meliloti]RVM96293.1 efflux RND transporter periplasmic adaptor subunit [Sinorhizobium meliloti]RVN12421.1 efflux RND transporter periplasmic adaptor subunit [Sinorhizobium m
MGVVKRRLAIWGSLLALLAAGIAYALRPQPVQVDLAVAEIGLLRVTLDEEGETRVRDVYTLHAPLRGQLQRITAEVGDVVEAGETQLAQIEPAPPAFLDVRTEAELQAAVEAARAAHNLAAAELNKAKADLTFAEGERARARQLIERRTISQRTLEDAERSYNVAQANLATAEAALKVREHELHQARSRLLSRQEIRSLREDCECMPVTAPVSGVVLQVMRRSEGVVEAGTPLLAIGDPADLEIVVNFLSEDAVRIRPGQRAIITDWGGEDLNAVVRRIEPFGQTQVSALGIEEQRVDVILDFADPTESWRSLGHGYRVDVQVILFEGEVLNLPLGALFRQGEEWAVFVAAEGRARLRPVAVSQRNSLAVEIREGLVPGERVILYPSDRIKDGAAIVER